MSVQEMTSRGGLGYFLYMFSTGLCLATQDILSRAVLNKQSLMMLQTKALIALFSSDL